MIEMNKANRDNIPLEPGCYIYYNKNREIIYIGKAKNLLSRVSSYFDRFQSHKTDELVKNIFFFDYIVTNNEKESLLLEINLIQKHKPKYNILLKDGRNYPYIRITNDEHPKVDYVLNRIEDNKQGTYFGPFPDSHTAKEITKIINNIYKFRKCKNIPNRKCIYYDIKLCHGPCINKLPVNIYDDDLKTINDFFKSKPTKLINQIKKMMYFHSEKNEFEEAMKLRDTIQYINNFLETQLVDSEKKETFDVISAQEINNTFGMYTLSVKNGLLLAHDFVTGSYTEIQETLINRYFSNNIDVYIDNIKLLEQLSVVLTKIKQAKIGKKRDLLNLASKNLQIQINKVSIENTKLKIVDDFFENILKLPNIRNIFMLDISHIGGEENVAGLVCFSDNIKNKKLYRNYKISFDENNDYKSMIEVATRISNNEILLKNMDLLIVDGGEIQINAVKRVFSDKNIDIPIIALEKNKKHITSTLIYDKEYILSDVSLLSYFSRIQDEAHRYANNYMSLRSFKNKTKSIFSNIKGVGPKKIKILEDNFSSIEDVASTSVEDLMNLGFNEKLAIEILIYLNK